MFNNLKNYQTVFHSGCTIFTFPPATHKGSSFSTSFLISILLSMVLDNSHPNGCQKVLTVVLICIFLMTNDIEHFFMCWSFAYLWRNVYSSTLHIFYVVCFLLSCRSSLYVLGFPGSSAGKESACNAGDLGSVPGLGRSPGEGKGYPLQYFCLENSMNGIALSTTE